MTKFYKLALVAISLCSFSMISALKAYNGEGAGQDDIKKKDDKNRAQSGYEN